jgi:hypothetical protein
MQWLNMFFIDNNFVGCQVPTIEYHNETWTWLDLLLSIKSKTRYWYCVIALKSLFFMLYNFPANLVFLSCTLSYQMF